MVTVSCSIPLYPFPCRKEPTQVSQLRCLSDVKVRKLTSNSLSARKNLYTFHLKPIYLLRETYIPFARNLYTYFRASREPWPERICVKKDTFASVYCTSLALVAQENKSNL